MAASDALLDVSLRTRYDSVRQRIQSAARRAGRRAEDVLLVAVSKSASPLQIAELAGFGHRDFGENRIQALIERVPEVAALFEAAGVLPDDVRWHMIGTLQRNKVRRAIELARLVHSIDTMRLAETVHDEAIRRDRVVDVMLQVNVSGEASKHGMNPRAVPRVIEQMLTMTGLDVRGLMTMAPLDAPSEAARPVFEACRELFEDVRRAGIVGPRFNLLSMGMSGDFEVAIECGANVIRVGSAIFGAPAPEPALIALPHSDRTNQDFAPAFDFLPRNAKLRASRSIQDAPLHG